MQRKYQLGSAVAFIVLGAGFAFEAQKLKLGRISRPEPGFFPFWLGMAMMAVAVLFFIQVYRKAAGFGGRESSLWHGVKWTKALFSLLAMLGYALVLERVGYLLTTFILLALLFRHVGSQNWRLTILGSMGTSFFTYLLFKVWLQVQLPGGFWGI